MKLSLKAFFLHEDAGCPSSSRKDEKALGSYKHPFAHLHKKFKGKKGVRDPAALAAHIKWKELGEASSEMWDDPFVVVDAMDGEPVLDDQGNVETFNSDGAAWDRARDLTDQGPDPGAAPEKDYNVVKLSDVDSKFDLGPVWGKNKSWADVPDLGEGLQLEYEDPTSSRHEEGDSKWSSPMSHKSGMPSEVPQDQAQERSADGWEEMRKSSDSHYPASSKSDLKAFFGDEPYPKSSRSSSKHSSKGSSHKVSEAEEPEDDDFEKLYAQMNRPKSGGEEKWPGNITFEPQPGDEGGVKQDEPDIDWSQMDDEEFLKAVQAGEVEPKPIPKKAEPAGASFQWPPPAHEIPGFEPFEAPPGEEYGGPGEEDYSWDEFRATQPDEAQELERDLPGEGDLAGAKFKQMPGGRWFMTTGSGQRMAYLGPKVGWEEMDDGESPVGEF